MDLTNNFAGLCWMGVKPVEVPRGPGGDLSLAEWLAFAAYCATW